MKWDADAGTLEFFKNNSSQGTISSIPSDYYSPAFTITSGSDAFDVNFGQRAFSYSAPTNHKPICTATLPTPTIADGGDYFEAKTYTGNGSTQSITGFQFSPDWVWYKDRGSTNGHALFDSVRGAQKRLRTMTTAAEVTDSTYLTSFDSNGFTVGSHVTGNTSGSSYVAWCWDAGSSTVSNTDGSVTSQVRANQTAGFSVVTCTGDSNTSKTVGHGLNAVPEMIIIKCRNATSDWPVFHKSTGNNTFCRLNLTNSNDLTGAGVMNNTSPTSSVFTVGDYSGTGDASRNFVAYCFAPVAGFSAMGVYEATRNPKAFVHTGFRPAFVLIKRTVGSPNANWIIHDTARSPYNVSQKGLFPSASDAEYTDSSINLDILSNGFFVHGTSAMQGYESDDYIYYAVAENPFQANGGLAR